MPAHPLCYLVDPMRAQTSDSHKLSSNSREHSGTCTHDRYKNVKKEKKGNLFKKYMDSQGSPVRKTTITKHQTKTQGRRAKLQDSEFWILK